MMLVECILDEFDKSQLPFTRTAILAALLDAAALKQPFADLETVGDLATVCDMLHRRRLLLFHQGSRNGYGSLHRAHNR